MRLILVDGVFVPSSGAWAFREMAHADAVEGIQLAFDEGALVNMVAQHSERLSKITGRNIVSADVGRMLSKGIETETVPGDMVLMYYEALPKSNGGLHRHLWLSAIRMDVTSVDGIGNLMARALPDDMNLLEFAACITEYAEELLIQKDDPRNVLNMPNEEVSGE